MYTSDGSLRLSATDLAKHLGCRHLTELDRQVALGTLNASTWHDPALALLQKRGLAHEEAYVAQCQAISSAPDWSLPYVNLGAVLIRQGKFDEAIAAYGTAIRLNPGYATPYYNLGNALSHQGNVDEAIQAYARAIRIDPDYTNAYVQLGNRLRDQGRRKEALDAFQNAIRTDPDDANAQAFHAFVQVAGEVRRRPFSTARVLWVVPSDSIENSRIVGHATS